MANKHPDDDLFAKSTMSIGEHLEELRGAMFRSVLGLAVGMAIGMCFASWVVDRIKAPLSDSLERYYINKTATQLAVETGDESLKKESHPIHEFLLKHHLIIEKQLVEVSEVNRLAKLLAAEEKKKAADKNKPAPEKSSERPAVTNTSASAPPAEFAIDIIGDDQFSLPTDKLLMTRVWKPVNSVVKALNAQEVFMIWMKAGLVVGAVIASPYIFLQIWNFVAAGLYPHEKKYVHIYLPFSLGLFIFGVVLCFEWVIPKVLDWLLTFNQWLNVDPDPRISEWLGFVLILPLGFGISFQLPLVMLLLNRIGLFSVQTYLAKWRIAVLVIFVISMVLTPADPVSMLFMAIPLTFLYFGGIGLCQWMPRGQNPFSEAYEP